MPGVQTRPKTVVKPKTKTSAGPWILALELPAFGVAVLFRNQNDDLETKHYSKTKKIFGNQRIFGNQNEYSETKRNDETKL